MLAAVDLSARGETMKFRLFLIMHRHFDMAAPANVDAAAVFRACVLDTNVRTDRLLGLIDEDQGFALIALGFGSREQLAEARGERDLQLLGIGSAILMEKNYDI